MRYINLRFTYLLTYLLNWTPTMQQQRIGWWLRTMMEKDSTTRRQPFLRRRALDDDTTSLYSFLQLSLLSLSQLSFFTLRCIV